MSSRGRTPEWKWKLANEAPYFDGRCETIISYNFEHRCMKPAVTIGACGFAVCDVHAKVLHLRDEDTNTNHVVERFDERAARFRFGHLSTSSAAQRLQAQWDF